MTSRIIRKVDQASKFANVCAAFSVKIDRNEHEPRTSVLLALAKTVEAIPVLTYVINDSLGSDGVHCYGFSSITLEDRLTYLIESDKLPTGQAVALQLVEESRSPANIARSLFAMKAVQYSDGIMFYLVVNHTITDGPSIFKIVDAFLQFLAAQLDESFLVDVPPASDRDIIGEVLSNPLSSTTPAADSLLVTPHNGMLTFPTLTDANADAKNNGCIRVVYRELNTETTSSILQSCRRNGVSFQSLLSAASALAFVKLLHRTGDLVGDLWDALLIQMTPANMRRFLTTQDNEAPLERVIAMGAAFLRWKMQPLHSYAALAARPFWSDFVHNEAQRPIKEVANSEYLLQSVHGGETGTVPYERQTYSLTTTSLGHLPVRPRYGALTVEDVHMHAGIWSQTQEQFDHPTVPAAMINSGTPMFALTHAYTVFGRLKLTGEYFGYSAEFITPYYDELERILVAAGSTHSAAETVLVGDIFRLD